MIDYIRHDHVVICGQRLDRPSRFSVTQWFEFWDAHEYTQGYTDGYEQGFDEAYLERGNA
jgi:hypothetical protein